MDSNAGLLAAGELVQVKILLAEHSLDRARETAETALVYYRSKSESESESLCLYYLATTAAMLGNKPAAREFAQQSLDILNSIKQKWGSASFAQYSSRPDTSNILRSLSDLAKS